MLSRVADAFFWMERYRERAENMARAIDGSLHLALDAVAGRDNIWGSVLKASGSAELYAELHGALEEPSAVHFLSFETRNPDSILSCLSRSRENARSVRDTLPADMWQELNTAYLYVAEAAERGGPGPTPHEFYGRVKRHCQIFTGIADTAMARGEAWHFSRLGTMLERADKTARLLEVKYYLLLPSVEYVGAPYDSVQWSALLDSVGAVEMFRRKHRQVIHANVVDFLVLDRDFPRSIFFCLSEAERSLRAITGGSITRPLTAPERLLGRLRAEVGYLSVEDVLKRGLHETLGDIQARLADVNAAVFDAFFARRPTGAHHDQ